MLPRGPGLLLINSDVIGLASHFGSVIVKFRPISAEFRPFSTRALRALKLRNLNLVDICVMNMKPYNSLKLKTIFAPKRGETRSKKSTWKDSNLYLLLVK